MAQPAKSTKTLPRVLQVLAQWEAENGSLFEVTAEQWLSLRPSVTDAVAAEPLVQTIASWEAASAPEVVTAKPVAFVQRNHLEELATANGTSVWAEDPETFFLACDVEVSDHPGAVYQGPVSTTKAERPVASLAEGSDTHSFRNFHRALCARFDYGHDPQDFRRDLVSLEEHIAKRMAAGRQASPWDRAAPLRRIAVELEALRGATSESSGVFAKRYENLMGFVQEAHDECYAPGANNR